MKKVLFLLISVMLFSSCTEYFSKGSCVGTITKLSNEGLIFKSYEATLNVTQTGMNSSGEPFEFSVDNDKKEEAKTTIATLDSAIINGWKVKVIYHSCLFKNTFFNRGYTNNFIDTLVIVDRYFSGYQQ